MSQYEQLLVSAKKLLHILEQLDLSNPMLDEAFSILRPIVGQVIYGKMDFPTKLPNRSFFLGCMSTHYQLIT